MNERVPAHLLTQQQVSDILDREADEYHETRAAQRTDWKRRQAIELPQPRKLEPTLVHKLHRMNPAEREEVRAILNALTLRKTIRATLREAQMQRLLSGIAQGPRFLHASPKTLTSNEREAALAYFKTEQRA